MKKLGIVLLLLASTAAFAFGGGGGGGRTRRFYERHGGVDAIGVHIHEHGKNPDILVCNPCEDPVDNQCVPRTCGDNQHCDTEQDACVCNDERYEINADNTCTVCSNGNVYLSYNTDPCGTETPKMNCTDDDDCLFVNCCDTVSHNCKPATKDVVTGTISCPIENGKQCTSNKDCANTEYCNLADLPWDPSLSYLPNAGICTQIGEYTDATIEGLGTVRKSNNPMTWWAAENWCRAQGKSLINISKFKCYKSGTNILVTEGAGGNYCCAESQLCGYDANWNIHDNFSPTLRALVNTFGDNNFWTASKCSKNSHRPTLYDMYTLEDGFAGNNPPYQDDFWISSSFYALCQ